MITAKSTDQEQPDIKTSQPEADTIKATARPEPEKKKRGRPSKASQASQQIESELAKQDQLEETFKLFTNPVKKFLDISANKMFLERFPKNSGVAPLADIELDALTEALIPVLHEIGWLDKAGNPYINLAITAGMIAFPRVTGFINYRNRIKSNEETVSQKIKPTKPGDNG